MPFITLLYLSLEPLRCFTLSIVMFRPYYNLFSYSISYISVCGNIDEYSRQKWRSLIFLLFLCVVWMTVRKQQKRRDIPFCFSQVRSRKRSKSTGLKEIGIHVRLNKTPRLLMICTTQCGFYVIWRLFYSFFFLI